MFEILGSDEYDGFKDLRPYNLVVDGKWWMLSPSPTAQLIRERFSPWYTGKLTWREIDSIKDAMVKVKNDLDSYTDKIYNDKCELIRLLKEQKKLCDSDGECTKKLNEHLKICGDKYKCDKNYVAYDCQFKENGRCSHHYEIERLDERLDNYQYVIDNYRSSYEDLEISYERALAVKENRFDEYRRQIEEYFD